MSLARLSSLLVLACLPVFAARADDLARWQERAKRVTIIRDHFGIPHVYGKTDADTVFGFLYAQAEDDFPRIELNYLNSIGRLAEVDGEKAIYSDLRMKLYIDPADIRAKYEASPAPLRALMDAFADGLNFFLATHPNVKPRLITHFVPWMALTFSEGSIGTDIETGISLRALEQFYGPRTGGGSKVTALFPAQHISPTSLRRAQDPGNDEFWLPGNAVVERLPLAVISNLQFP